MTDDDQGVSVPREQLLRLKRLPGQLLRRNPFRGSIRVGSVPLVAFGSGRKTQPFPHPWNYQRPLDILETMFWNSDQDDDGARHNRYLDVPGFAPVLVTRDPEIIRAISASTGARPGQFDRDTLPSTGIARATGSDTLLYANGPRWKHQKKLATPPFARTTLFRPETFGDFERTFRATVSERLQKFRERVASSSGPFRVELDPEIKAIMLEMLVNNFFGADVPYDEIRERYVPSLDRVIDHIVRDTVINKIGVPLHLIPSLSSSIRETKRARADFERLTDLVIETRAGCRGLWREFRSDAPDDALRSNIRVFLAGALEATTSYASWALSHLARDAESQDALFEEVRHVDEYTPEALSRLGFLNCVLNETLRLTPSLYFHPRRATADTVVERPDGETLRIPRGTHILLDVWHANRHEDHWGVERTGFPADRFVPRRWEGIDADSRSSTGLPHFGFGHGPRFCPGKSLGQMEAALVVGACVKLFELRAVNPENLARAGVSTKPRDGVLVELSLRDGGTSSTVETARNADSGRSEPGSGAARCPFRH